MLKLCRLGQKWSAKVSRSFDELAHNCVLWCKAAQDCGDAWCNIN